jgi:hypothetical protein
LGRDERHRDQRRPLIHFRRHTGKPETNFEDSARLFRLIAARIERHLPEYLKFFALVNGFSNTILWKMNSTLYQEIYGSNN